MTLKNFLPVLIAFFIGLASESYSQHSSSSVNGMHISMQDMSLKSQGPNDPLHDSLLVSVSFNVTNPNDISALDFNYGTVDGGANLLSKKAHYINKNGKEYVECNGELYPIVGGHVTVHHMLSKSKINSQHVYLTISGTHKKGGHMAALHNMVK